MKKYIYFEIIEEKPKTKVWAIFNKNDLSQLGIIKWFGSWRQYCFFPEPETLWSVGCLQDVIDFIVGEDKARKALKERKNEKEDFNREN